MKKKVVIIGAGYMALEHAKVFASIDAFSLVGIYSRTTKKTHLLAKQFNMQVFDSIEEMYIITKAELVIVTVNELSMAEVCRAIFQYPWLCLLEKPVGYNYQQACFIKQLAVDYGHQPFVALNRRSYSSTRQALERLNLDLSTRLVSIMDQQSIEMAKAAGFPELVADNFMYANSIHLIDYFNVFCRGEIVSVDCSIPWERERPRYVSAAIKYSSGDIGLYQAVWDGPGPWGVSITNSNYRFEMRPLETLKVQTKGSRFSTDIPTDPMDISFKPGLFFQAEQILNYFNGGKANLPNLDDSLISMKLCYLIYERSNVLELDHLL